MIKCIKTTDTSNQLKHFKGQITVQQHTYYCLITWPRTEDSAITTHTVHVVICSVKVNKNSAGTECCCCYKLQDKDQNTG